MLLNVDSAVSGPELDVDGVPSLRDLMLEAAGSIHDVRSGRPLRDVWMAKRRAAWASTAPVDLDGLWDGTGRVGRPGEDLRPPPTGRKFSPQMNALGSGSDYTAFLDHLGVPAARRGLQRPLRRLSLDLRRLLLDGEVRRPRVRHPRHGRPALHPDRDEGRERRGRPAPSSSPTARPSASTSTTSGGSSPARPRTVESGDRRAADRLRGLAAAGRLDQGLRSPGDDPRRGDRGPGQARRRRPGRSSPRSTTL